MPPAARMARSAIAHSGRVSATMVTRAPAWVPLALREPGGQSTAAPAPAAPLGALPVWDLSDLYPSREGPEIGADLERARAAAAGFAERYQGKLAGLDGPGLAGALGAYEELDERLSRLMSYAQLVY